MLCVCGLLAFRLRRACPAKGFSVRVHYVRADARLDMDKCLCPHSQYLHARSKWLKLVPKRRFVCTGHGRLSVSRYARICASNHRDGLFLRG